MRQHFLFRRRCVNGDFFREVEQVEGSVVKVHTSQEAARSSLPTDSNQAFSKFTVTKIKSLSCPYTHLTSPSASDHVTSGTRHAQHLREAAC